MGVRSTFAERLKELRLGAELSQQEFGELFGVSRGSISYYEQQSRVADIEFVHAVAVHFGRSVDWLLGLSGAEWLNEDAGIKQISQKTGLHPMTIRLLEEISSRVEDGHAGLAGYRDYIQAAEAAIGMHDGKYETGGKNQTFLRELADLKRIYISLSEEMERELQRDRKNHAETAESAAALFKAVVCGGRIVGLESKCLALQAEREIVAAYESVCAEMNPVNGAAMVLRHLRDRAMLRWEPIDEYENYVQAARAKVAEDEIEAAAILPVLERFYGTTKDAVTKYRGCSQTERNFPAKGYPGFASLQWDISRVKRQTEKFIDEYLRETVERFNAAVMALMKRANGLADTDLQEEILRLMERSDLWRSRDIGK